MARERSEFIGEPFGAWEAEAFKELKIEKSIDVTDQCNLSPEFEILLNYATQKAGQIFFDGRLVEVKCKRINENKTTLGWHFYLYTLEKGYSEVLELATALERDLGIKSDLLVEMILTHAREEEDF